MGQSSPVTQTSDQPPFEEILAIRVTMMPRDTNAHGTIFGGHILSLIDQAGAIAGHAVGGGQLVTVAMNEVVFKEPVRVGDLVTCYGLVTRVGTTSIRVRVRVVAQAPVAEGGPGPVRDVTQADVVYVNMGDDGTPTPMTVGSGGRLAT